MVTQHNFLLQATVGQSLLKEALKKKMMKQVRIV